MGSPSPAEVRRKEKKPRPKDLVFEAVCEGCGWELDKLTPTERGRLNRAVKELKDVGATAEEVGLFALYWELKYPDAQLTPQAMTGNWSAFQSGSLTPRTGGGGYGKR